MRGAPGNSSARDLGDATGSRNHCGSATSRAAGLVQRQALELVLLADRAIPVEAHQPGLGVLPARRQGLVSPRHAARWFEVGVGEAITASSRVPGSCATSLTSTAAGLPRMTPGARRPGRGRRSGDSQAPPSPTGQGEIDCAARSGSGTSSLRSTGRAPTRTRQRAAAVRHAMCGIDARVRGRVAALRAGGAPGATNTF